jgi:type IV pilus assembly protein PilA
MLKYLQRSRNKKGFSLVELIVVISIIAIMSAVAIPNAIAYNRRAEGRSQNAHATAFYFALQQTLLNLLEYDHSPDEFRWGGNLRTEFSGTEYFHVYYTKETGPNDTGLKRGSGGTNVTDDTAEPSFRLFINQLDKYMAGAEQEGYYYAIFDGGFRVVVAYYSKFHDQGNASTPTGITAPNRLDNGHNFGAFPILNSRFGNVSWEGGTTVDVQTIFNEPTATSLRNSTDNATQNRAANR